MSKLSIQIGRTWLVGGLLLGSFFESGCKPDATSQPQRDPFATTNPENQPGRVKEDNDPSEEDDGSPRIPGYVTEKIRKDFLRERFNYEEVGDPPPMIETSSGLKYRILEQGTGDQVTPDARIAINYLAKLEDGFSYDGLLTGGKRGDIPEKAFVPQIHLLSNMIEGWKEGLILLKEGGLIELEIPPSLGFGETGNPNKKVPPNAKLFHLVRVLTINPKLFRDVAREIIVKENFKESDGQIFYKILKQTDGKRASFTDIVTINYTVHRVDGIKYIDTYETGEPLRTPVIKLVKGMSEGVKMIGEGGIIELILSPEKGFGRHSQTDPVPDNTIARVKIELVKVEPNAKLGLPTGNQQKTNGSDAGATDDPSKTDKESQEQQAEEKQVETETKSEETTPVESPTPKPETESSTKTGE